MFLRTRTTIRSTLGGPIIYLVSCTCDQVHVTGMHADLFRDYILTSLQCHIAYLLQVPCITVGSRLILASKGLDYESGMTQYLLYVVASDTMGLMTQRIFSVRVSTRDMALLFNPPSTKYQYTRFLLNQYIDYIFQFLMKRAFIQVPKCQI